jgi:hypothetical protein
MRYGFRRDRTIKEEVKTRGSAERKDTATKSPTAGGSPGQYNEKPDSLEQASNKANQSAVQKQKSITANGASTEMSAEEQEQRKKIFFQTIKSNNMRQHSFNLVIAFLFLGYFIYQYVFQLH